MSRNERTLMANITLVIGGARSGKSSYASRLALSACEAPVYAGRPVCGHQLLILHSTVCIDTSHAPRYVATARRFDGDMAWDERIAARASSHPPSHPYLQTTTFQLLSPSHHLSPTAAHTRHATRYSLTPTPTLASLTLHSSPPPPQPNLRRHLPLPQLHRKDRGPPWVDVEEQKLLSARSDLKPSPNSR